MTPIEQVLERLRRRKADLESYMARSAIARGRHEELAALEEEVVQIAEKARKTDLKPDV